jgi:signal transduction histidine kinase
MYHYTISVKDNGPGIPVEAQKFLFNEMHHHDFINIYKDDNYLSLPLCKQLATNIGGDIILESESSEGAIFTLVLPVFNKIRK